MQTRHDRDTMSEARAFILLPRDPSPEKGRIVIRAAGTGNPFFTTDSAALGPASQVRHHLQGDEGQRHLHG